MPSIWCVAAPLPASASVSFPSNNRIYYVPFRVPVLFTAAQLAVIVGTTNTANVEAGIYTADGRRLVTGGVVAQGTASTAQVFDITNTLLYPGLYYFAVTLSSTGGSLFFAAAGGAPGARMSGTVIEGGAGGLPATATFAALGDNLIPAFAVAQGSVL